MRFSSWKSAVIGSVLTIGGLAGCGPARPGTLPLDDGLVKQWRMIAAISQREIEKFFCERYGWPHMMPIPPEDASALLTAARPASPASSNEEDLWSTRNRVVEMLEAANIIAMKLRGRRDQRERTKGELGPSLVAWRSYLCSFTNLVDEREHRPVWKEFYGLADSWADSFHRAARPCRK
jgi:hypothetical protein